MVIFYKGWDANDTGFYGKTIFNWYDIFLLPHYYYIWSLFTKYVWFKWKNDTGLMEIIIDNDNEHDNDADIGNYWLLIK